MRKILLTMKSYTILKFVILFQPRLLTLHLSLGGLRMSCRLLPILRFRNVVKDEFIKLIRAWLDPQRNLCPLLNLLKLDS